MISCCKCVEYLCCLFFVYGIGSSIYVLFLRNLNLGTILMKDVVI